MAADSTASAPGGFTLIEVLVALAVATFALTFFMSVLGEGLVGSRKVERRAEATILAESTLESLGVVSPLVQNEYLQLRKSPFVITTETHRYSWPAQDGYLVPYQVTVTVAWQDGGQSRSLRLSTLRLGSPG